jgi:uncharacterized membrane protein
MEYYLTIKLIHIISSTILFGTGLGSAFYMWMTYRGGNAIAFSSVIRLVVLADWVFTTPAVIIQPVTGLILLHIAGYSFDLLWLKLSIVLYILIGFCWIPVVWIQIRIKSILESKEVHQHEINRLMKMWFALGCPAFIGVIAIFYLMVCKPL